MYKIYTNLKMKIISVFVFKYSFYDLSDKTIFFRELITPYPIPPITFLNRNFDG